MARKVLFINSSLLFSPLTLPIAVPIRSAAVPVVASRIPVIVVVPVVIVAVTACIVPRGGFKVLARVLIDAVIVGVVRIDVYVI